MGWRDRLADIIRGSGGAPVGSGTAEGRILAEGVKDYTLAAAMADSGWYSLADHNALKRDAPVDTLAGYSKASVAVYACARVRSQTLSQVPLRLYKVNKDGSKTPVLSGNLFNLLKRVNNHWTGQRLVDATEQALCYNGESFWVLNRESRRKPPTEIWWARPDCMIVNRGKTGKYIDGYTFISPFGQKIDFDPDEVIWIPYFNPTNEFKGLSPLHAAQLSVDTSIDAMTSNRKFFRNGMNIGGVISPKDGHMPFGRDQAKQFEDDLHRRFTGVDKHHRWMVLSNAADVKNFGLSQKDAELLELMKWTLNDVCRVYNVPPTIVQDFSRSTYNNADAAQEMFWSFCIIPEGVFIASEITEKLLPLFPGEADICEFDFSGVKALQEDETEIVDMMAKLQLMGVPLNALLHLYKPDLIPPGSDGYPWGDQPLLMPGQPMPGEVDETVRTMLVTPIKPKPGATQERSLSDLFAEVKTLLVEAKADVPAFGSDEHQALMTAFETQVAPVEAMAKAQLAALFRRQSADLAERLRNQAMPAKTAVKATEDEDDGTDEAMAVALLLLLAMYPNNAWADWTIGISTGLQPILASAFRVGSEAAAADLGIAVPGMVLLQATQWANARQAQSAAQINDTTWRQVQAAMADGIRNNERIEDLIRRVHDVMELRAGQGAGAIAETEVLTAYNEAQLRVYEASGAVDEIAWLTKADNAVRDAHRRLHGQRQPIGQMFAIPTGPYQGFKARGPGQFGVEALDLRCRCRIWAVPRPQTPKASRNGHSKAADRLIVEVR